MLKEVSPQRRYSIEDQGRAQQTVVNIIEYGRDEGPARVIQEGDAVGQSIEKSKEHKDH